MSSNRKPWVRKGVKLGFIRGPVYWIDRTVAGRRYQVTTQRRTPDAAFGEYQKFEKDPANYRAAVAPADGESTWDTLVVKYLEWTKTVRNNSEKHREAVTNRLADWGSFKNFHSPASFTKDDVEAFMKALREGQVTRRKRRNHVTGEVEEVPSYPGQPTVNRYLAALKGFMTWCRTNHHTTNVADREVTQAREHQNVRPPESVEQERWMAVAKHLDERWLRAQEVLLGTGMRYGELAKMRAENFRPAGIAIPWRKGFLGTVLPVTPACLASARRLLELGGVPNDEGGQMGHRLADAARAAGVKRYTAHHLRHTFGTTVLRSGKVDLKTLQIWMGHASISTTEKYLHAVRAEQGMAEGIAPF